MTELVVVIAVMAILLGISVPTARHLMDSFESSTGVRYLINAALSNGRAIAVRNQAYAGVRFQQGTDGFTYMIFVVQDSAIAQGVSDPVLKGELSAYGFRAVVGRNPMKLPDGVTVDQCSVVFSPAGKLTTHLVRVWNKDGKTESDSIQSNDTIFNTKPIVDAGNAMFYQDDYDPPFDDNTPSVQQLTLSTKSKYDSVVESSTEFISPYTGDLVMEYREKSL